MIRRCALVLAAAAALLVAGCGNKQDITTEAPTEGIYLDLGGMKYQIQMSRYLNPKDVEDRSYLAGLPTGVAAGNNNVWFGIWMRVENLDKHPHAMASQYEIHDTQGGVFRPVPLDPRSNPFSYQPGNVEPGNIFPLPDSAAGNGPIQGSLILFKIPVDSLQNRPLVLKMTQGGTTATADIDV
jgi:hypothetical protein